MCRYGTSTASWICVYTEIEVDGATVTIVPCTGKSTLPGSRLEGGTAYLHSRLTESPATIGRRFCPPCTLVDVGGIRRGLGSEVADAVSKFCRLSWNRTKHHYLAGHPGSVISIEDAIGSYFVARALGRRYFWPAADWSRPLALFKTRHAVGDSTLRESCRGSMKIKSRGNSINPEAGCRTML